MEPSPKRNKTDARQLSPVDAEDIRKLTTASKKHLRVKAQQKKEVEEELRAVNDFVKRDGTLRIFVKRVGLNVPMEAIMVIFFTHLFFHLINILYYYRTSLKCFERGWM
jgi:hypothetical protein